MRLLPQRVLRAGPPLPGLSLQSCVGLCAQCRPQRGPHDSHLPRPRPSELLLHHIVLAPHSSRPDVLGPGSHSPSPIGLP